MVGLIIYVFRNTVVAMSIVPVPRSVRFPPWQVTGVHSLRACKSLLRGIEQNKKTDDAQSEETATK